MVSVDDEYEYELRARVRLLSLVLSGPDMGTIHVNLLDGHDITAADRNGKSDVSLCVSCRCCLYVAHARMLDS